MPEGVLREDEALELFAYLLTSARTQLDDPARYASMRLLSAAEDLRDLVADRVSPELAAMFRRTVALGSFAQEQVNDREAYVGALDELCRIVARTLVAREGLGGSGDG
jgi:Family of unknown function (DUF6092)